MKLKTWQTKQGTLLLISEMDTTHILNCIEMIENRVKNSFSCWVHYRRRNNYIINKTLSDFVPKVYFDLKEELKHRINNGSIYKERFALLKGDNEILFARFWSIRKLNGK